MKFILGYVIVLLSLSANEVLSKHNKSNGKVIGNGTQIPGGFFSNTIQGDIPASTKMTSSFIISPENEAVLEPLEPFSVDLLIDNLETGFFSDPKTQYINKPQSLNNEGIIKGHSHVSIQLLEGNRPPDSEKFAFFDGLNDKAEGELLSVEVKSGLSAGRYRICAMSASFSHQPLVMPIAKRGAQDDCIRITVGGTEGKCIDDEKCGDIPKSGKNNPKFGEPKNEDNPKIGEPKSGEDNPKSKDKPKSEDKPKNRGKSRRR